MEESKRQRQVAALLNETLSEVLRKQGFNIINNGMVSISRVKVTPDLLEARVYLSFYNIPEPAQMMEQIAARSREIKKDLAARVGKQLRRMPVLVFHIDDTLDYVFKMEDLFAQIHRAESDNGSPDAPPLQS
jgi:ribosome-binding factor A